MMVMSISKYYVDVELVCVSVVLCHLFVPVCGLLQILPPHDSTTDPNVVISNICRHVFVCQWPVPMCMRHKQHFGWQPVFQWALVSTSNVIFHVCHSQNPVQEWGEEFEDGAVYGVTLRREPVTSDSNSSETDQCCAFVQYRTCKVRRLKAATLDLLVSHLLDPGCQEQDYGRIFLSTYGTFTSTSELIELLFQRYNHILDTILLFYLFTDIGPCTWINISNVGLGDKVKYFAMVISLLEASLFAKNSP